MTKRSRSLKAIILEGKSESSRFSPRKVLRVLISWDVKCMLENEREKRGERSWRGKDKRGREVFRSPREKNDRYTNFLSPWYTSRSSRCRALINFSVSLGRISQSILRLIGSFARREYFSSAREFSRGRISSAGETERKRLRLIFYADCFESFVQMIFYREFCE